MVYGTKYTNVRLVFSKTSFLPFLARFFSQRSID